MVTEGTSNTDMVMVLLVAVDEVAQGLFDVSTQVMVLPLASVLDEYTLLLVPTLAPFNFHW